MRRTLAGWAPELLLFGGERRWLDALLTITAVAVLLWSRLSLLAAGPWEWDETLFAHGLVKFSLAAHFPHPPGFPGWLAIGHLFLPLAQNPLHALQIASALFSVAAVWPMARLGRRVAPPAVAACAALLVLFLPGPWLHAVRGFSSTAAGTLALGAAAVLAGGLEGRRSTVFSLLIAASFLVRPILLPPLAVLWLGGVISVRPLRRLLPGIGLATAAVALSVMIMAWAEGGWGRFVEAFMAHGGRHFSRLVDNPGGWSELGLVKGLGGSLPALVLLAVATVGLGRWWVRAGRRGAVLWLVVLLVFVGELLWLQNRTYTRYPVALQMALAPLLAGAACMAPAAVAVGGLLLVCGLAGWHAYPLLEEQHTTHLPAWQAVQTAAEAAQWRKMAVVVAPDLHPFASYRWHWQGRGELAADPQLVLSPWAPEVWTGVESPYLVATDFPERFLAPLAGGSRQWAGVSERLLPFTQARMLQAAVISNPPLPIRGWWPPEQLPDGERFMWGGADAELCLPPLPPFTWLELDLRPAAGDAELVVEVNGRKAQVVAGDANRSRVWVDPQLLLTGRAQRLVLRRAQGYRPGGGDTRPLAVQLYGVRAVGGGLPWQGSLATPRERERNRLLLDGAWGPERFGRHGRACWVRPEAWLEVPAGDGVLTLTLWSPRPLPSDTVLRVGGRRVAGPLGLGNRPADVEVRLAADDAREGRVRMEIISVPLIPAEAGTGADTRQLGVVVQSVRWQPAGDAWQRWAWE